MTSKNILIENMSLTCLNVHIVFSTKHRRKLIEKDWKEELHKYIGGIIKDLKAVPLAIGGIDDHIHLLVGLKSFHRPDYLIRDIKSGSTKWVKRNKRGLFAWQKGYAAFSVSPDRIDGVKNYVLNQEEHHKKESFVDELIGLLEEAGIEYDPEYLL